MDVYLNDHLAAARLGSDLALSDPVTQSGHPADQLIDTVSRENWCNGYTGSTACDLLPTLIGVGASVQANKRHSVQQTRLSSLVTDRSAVRAYDDQRRP